MAARGQKIQRKQGETGVKASPAKGWPSKKASLHGFWHSYAAHLLKLGPDQRSIQELLGHSSSKTTERYTHASTKNLQQIHLPFYDLQKIYTLDSGKENYAYTSKSANWRSFTAPINELALTLKDDTTKNK